MEQVVVRPAAPGDLDNLLKFEQAIIEYERPFDTTLRSGGDIHYYDLTALIASPDVEVLVAEVGGLIVGSGYAQIKISELYLEHRKYSYLGFMYVVPEHRGKGINKMIVEELEAWSIAKGVTEMRLEVYAENIAAIRAYEKSGYRGLLLQMRKSLAED